MSSNQAVASTSKRSDSHLRNEISFVGSLLGETIREIAGETSFESVETLRRLAWDRRSALDDDSGIAEADQAIVDYISSLPDDQLLVVIRSFSIFLDLLNLSEDRQRVRVLEDRAREAYPEPKNESVRKAVADLKASGVSPEQMQVLLDQLHVELVFTAHPTDAKRRSVRKKLTRLRDLLAKCDESLLPSETEAVHQDLRAELAKLWQTDFIRPWKPSVIYEVNRGLSIKPVLWNEVPKILDELHRAVALQYGDSVKVSRPCVTFGSWIGGDRDGHPGVTAEVTKQTYQWLRDAAIEFHLAACSELFDSLSLSSRYMKIETGLADAIRTAQEHWPDVAPTLEEVPPSELFRRWLLVIRWRLNQTQKRTLDAPDVAVGSYANASELAADVQVLFEAVSCASSGQLLSGEVEMWQRRIETFGFHLARLDIRQDARVYKEVLDELFKAGGVHADPGSLDESGRTETILNSIKSSFQVDYDRLQPITKDTLDLFALMHRVADTFGSDAIGGHVISMTGAPSDVMTVLWFWNQTRDPETKHRFDLPIVPLFETIEDLHAAPEILTGMLAASEYKEHLARQKNEQVVMLGYSDSTKDGGYLSACWSLHQAQKELVELASTRDIALVFFHGRGGSLGRGGGPAARSILSLPVGTFQGSLRLTEQGEVLADRYDDPSIAHRHLEQVVWSSMLSAGKPAEPDPPAWCDLMDRMADISHRNYRKLVEQDGFVDFFRLVTPLSEIEQLPIGSRPSRRRGGKSLSDLRAIPWVFSWTQSRCLIPAWYGLGSALCEMMGDETVAGQLKQMYQEWPFFRACIDNAELALAKTDLDIAEHYATLSKGAPTLDAIADMVASEFRQSRESVLALSGMNELLDGIPWLKESIRVRNRYIDPLNLIQVELLKRCHAANDPDAVAPELRHLARLTINGIAAGMRTSG